jgi:hypothetical protein
MPTRLHRDGMAPNEMFFDKTIQRALTTYVEARCVTYVKKNPRSVRG